MVGAHSGRQRGRGYVEASDAAWELLAAAVDPFVVRLRQLVDLACETRPRRWAPASSWGCLSRAATTDAPFTFEPDFVTEKGAEVLADMEELSLDVEGLGTID